MKYLFFAVVSFFVFTANANLPCEAFYNVSSLKESYLRLIPESVQGKFLQNLIRLDGKEGDVLVQVAPQKYHAYKARIEITEHVRPSYNLSYLRLEFRLLDADDIKSLEDDPILDSLSIAITGFSIRPHSDLNLEDRDSRTVTRARDGIYEIDSKTLTQDHGGLLKIVTNRIFQRNKNFWELLTRKNSPRVRSYTTVYFNPRLTPNTGGF